jgi:flagellar hook-associated protein FlgK
MCHFHQKAIIRRYLTKKPKLKPNQELKEIADWLNNTDKESFTKRLDDWYNKYKDWLNEQ